MNRKLKNPNNKHKQIVHYTSLDQHKRANAAYLIASFAILYLKKTPNEVYKSLNMENAPLLKPFQDASMGASMFNINLLGENFFMNWIQISILILILSSSLDVHSARKIERA